MSRSHPMKAIVMGVAICGLALSDSLFAQSELEEVIEEVRRATEAELGPARLGSGYAAMINFAVAPEISTANYSVEDSLEDDPELQVTRVPLRHVFEPNARGWSPFIQGNLAYQTFDASFPFLEGEQINGEWDALGVSVAGGYEIPLSENLTLLPVLDLGYVRLTNDATYTGPIGNTILKPALEGLLFDWDADTWLLGLSLGFEYEKPYERFTLQSRGGITYNRIDTFSTSSDAIDFTSSVTTTNLKADFVIPTSMSVGGSPLAVVPHIGATAFLGDDRDALGFDHFYEAGLSFEADVAERGWRISKLRLGAMVIFGSDVSGWGILLGYRF